MTYTDPGAAVRRCERIARATNLDNLPRARRLIFGLMYECALDPTDVERVLKAMKRSVPELTLRSLQDSWVAHRDAADAERRAAAGDGDGGDGDSRGPTQAQRLVELYLAQDVTLFHAPDETAYAEALVNGHREIHEVRRKQTRSLLARLYWEDAGKPPGSQALQDAANVLEGLARFDGEERPVFTRLAGVEGKIYLDLADEEWRVVEIDTAGWRVLARSAVAFRRPKGLEALPMPIGGGDLRELWDFVNLTPEERPLLLAFLVACLNPDGPYPVLILIAEQGSGKSTQARLLKLLVDPNLAPLRTTPRDERDMYIGAGNALLLALDNLSNISPQLSDGICRLSTGGSMATRELYSDAEETIFTAMRPVILTGIDDLATRPDLLDRAILLNLPRIPADQRRTERELMAAFEKARPALLGALLDAVAAGLRNLPTTHVQGAPRMADFATWAAACEPALGLEPGAFLEAYRANRANANSLALDVSPLPTALTALTEHHTAWEGRVSELLSLLDEQASEADRKHKAWPKSASSLSNKLRRLAPNLREAGIDLDFMRTSEGAFIRVKAQDAVNAVTPSLAPREARPARETGSDGVHDGAARDDGVAVTSHAPSHAPSHQKRRPARDSDGGDGVDGAMRPHSNGRSAEGHGIPREVVDLYHRWRGGEFEGRGVQAELADIFSRRIPTEGDKVRLGQIAAEVAS